MELFIAFHYRDNIIPMQSRPLYSIKVHTKLAGDTEQSCGGSTAMFPYMFCGKGTGESLNKSEVILRGCSRCVTGGGESKKSHFSKV